MADTEDMIAGAKRDREESDVGTAVRGDRTHTNTLPTSSCPCAPAPSPPRRPSTGAACCSLSTCPRLMPPGHTALCALLLQVAELEACLSRDTEMKLQALGALAALIDTKDEA